jgi:TonB-linked SusC/RagA family outer membrane protein
MEDVASDWLSNLKLRLSFGTAGNDRVSSDYYEAWTTKSTSYVDGETSYWTPGNSLYNPNIKWETTFTRNLGIDFGFFNNRLSGSIEAYWNSTKDLLINMPIPGTGYEYQTQNIGSTSNKGVELQLNAVIVDKKDFGFDFSFNVGYNKNRVESLGGLTEMTASSGWASSRISDDYRVYVGQPVGLMYGYVTDGFYTTDDFDVVNGKWVAKDGVVDNSEMTGNAWGPGAIKFKDLNGDGVIDSNDRKVIGNSNPDFTGGFNIGLRYKNFDFASNFTFVVGNDIYNANKIEFTSNDLSRNYRNMLTSMSSDKRYSRVDMNTGAVIYDKATLDAMNADATMWIPFNKFALHSWAVEDGSFLRLNNLTVGYTLPKSITSKVKLSNVRFYFSGNNLFCLTKYSGFDPEVDTRRKTPLTPGVDYSAYPKSRSYNFGVNLSL